MAANGGGAEIGRGLRAHLSLSNQIVRYCTQNNAPAPTLPRFRGREGWGNLLGRAHRAGDCATALRRFYAVKLQAGGTMVLAPGTVSFR